VPRLSSSTIFWPPLEQSECGEISRMDDIKYAYRHFRGPDGKVYGLTEQK
jgi:hypothetical protein